MFDEEELLSNNAAFLFYREQLVRNRQQVTVFSNTSIENLSYQERRNRILYIIQLLLLRWNGLIHRPSLE